MKETTERTFKKAAKVGAIILAVFAVIICFAQLWLLVWGGDKLIKLMQERISEGSDGLYQFDAEKANLSLFGSSVVLRNATLAADTSVYFEQKDKNEADDNIYEIEIKNLRLYGLNLIKLIRDDEFRISGLKLESPVIKIYDDPEVDDKKSDDKAKFTLYSLFSPNLDLVKIESLVISNGSLEMIKSDQDSVKTLHVYNLTTDFSEIFVDSSHSRGNDKLFNAEKMDFSTDSLFMSLENGLYHLTAKNIVSSSRDEFLSLDNIILEPQAAKFDFAHHYGHENDRINLLIDDIFINHVSLIKMLQTGEISAGKVTLNHFNMHAFRDKRLKLADKHNKLPQQLLRELQISIQIDTLDMKSSRVSYEEFPDTGDEAGNIFFSNINARVLNITNKKENENTEIKIQASGYVFGTSRLDANFNIPVFNSSNVFYFSGTVGETDATSFNAMSVPVAGVEIKSAKLSKMEFNAQANENNSTGTMKLYYENLELNVRDQESGRKKGLQSFIANVFVVKNSNPKNGEFREGEMRFERDKRKAITNFCWKTILSGMKSSIGMSADLSNEDE